MLAKYWENSPTLGDAGTTSQTEKFRIPQFSAIFYVWHGLCRTVGMTPDGPDGRHRSKTMTLSYANMQSIVASVFGALIVSSMFISAAGSVPIA